MNKGKPGERSWLHVLHVCTFSFVVGLSQFLSSAFPRFSIVLLILFCTVASNSNSDISKIEVRIFNNLLDIVICLFI